MSYFPLETNSTISLEYIREFQDWAVKVEFMDLKEFFESLARLISKIFKPQLVTIWDNNTNGECLVLQASNSKNKSVLACHTMPTKKCYTGIAIEKKDIIILEDIYQPIKGKKFINVSLFNNLGLNKIVSVPVFISSKKGVVNLIINLCYDSFTDFHSPITEDDTKRLVSRLGMLIEHQIYKRGYAINELVRNASTSVSGIRSLFDNLSSNIQEMLSCNNIQLFTYNTIDCKFNLEATLKSENNTYTSLLDNNDSLCKSLKNTCIENKTSLVISSEYNQQKRNKIKTIQCKFIATPIISSENKAIGIIVCRDPFDEGRTAPSFSSLDIQTLKFFSEALSPVIERFLRLRGEDRMMITLKAVSASMVKAYELDRSLQNTIETITEILQSKVGSIYLIDQNTKLLKMEAGYGSNKSLIGNATYKIGEGITGAIAEGKLLNFKSREELISHPKYSGKYDAQIWGNNPDQKETFMGVPIVSSGKTIGVWKVSNIVPTKHHPESYYTDEDVQIAQVISSFLAYAIQNHRLEANRVKRFISLANTSIEIQSANDEDDAIAIVLLSLEEIGFKSAIVSLYNHKTGELAPSQSFGKKSVSNEEIFNYNSDNGLIWKVIISNNPQLNGDQFILPLRLDEEIIGALQVEVGFRFNLNYHKSLILRAFASHLSIALSRLRSIKKTIELTNGIMVSSRFLTAETLSAMAVHSIHHKLKDMTTKLGKDLEKKEIKENNLLLTTFSGWGKSLSELEKELKNILRFVKSPNNSDEIYTKDLHEDIKNSIEIWYNYIRSQNCKIQLKLEALNCVSKISSAAFKEILAVLLVNAVQAHAKLIEIRTYNDISNSTSLESKNIPVFCLICSDNGDGIHANNVEEIFEPNFTTKNENYGTGLGLFVASRLAKNCYGNIKVIPETKKTIFLLTLPIIEK